MVESGAQTKLNLVGHSRPSIGDIDPYASDWSSPSGSKTHHVFQSLSGTLLKVASSMEDLQRRSIA
jgi:hypothetical protein